MQKNSDSYRSSKISMVWRSIVAALGVAAFIPTLSLAAFQNPFCQSALVDKHFEAAPGEVKAAIAARTAPLRRGEHFIIDRKSGAKIDVLEALNRELAMPVLDSSKVRALEQIKELTDAWGKAFIAEIEAVYAGKLESRTKGAETTRFDSRGLPDSPIIQANAELALEILKTAKDKPGPAHLESQVARQLIDRLRKETFEKVKEVANQKKEEAEDYLAETLGEKSPDWYMAIDAIRPIYRDYVETLAEKFPLESGLETSDAARELLRQPLERFVNKAVVAEDGSLELQVPDLKIKARYDAELGTTVLEPLAPVLIRKDQKKGNLDAPVFLTDHGDGTVKSNASSWKYILSKFFSSGYNAIAMNLPKSGIGMDLTGLRSTVAYLHYRFQTVAKRFARKAGEVILPIIQLGRSMGSQKGFAHALLHEGENNPVHAYVLTSLSNPFTIALQLKNVYQQVKNGTIKGVVPEMLDNASLVSRELVEMLVRIKENDPKAFDLFGDKMLMLQGNADEDGGATALPDLIAFQKEYAPLAHVYAFENKLAEHNIPHLELIDPEQWEGTHTLFSNKENFEREDLKAAIARMEARARKGELKGDEPKILEALKAIDERVPDEDLAALQDQYFEAMGAMWGFYDYLADSRVQMPAIQASAKVFKDYRQKLTGGRTYLEWFRERSKISEKDFNAATPGRKSRPARLKRAAEYWKSERVRVEKVYREMGLLP